MRILSVCGMGFGTSLMLLMDVQAIAKKHGYTVDGEATDLGSAKGRECDFIIAGSEIASELEDSGVEVVSINNMLDKNEIEEKVMPVIIRLAEGEK